MTTTPDYARLIERLEKVEPDTPGEGVTRYYRNPDGPGAAAAFRTLLESKKELERHLGDLLAIIHRDGGHYQAQYGDQKAVDDAHKIWAGLITRAEAAEAERDALAAENERLKEDRARFPDRPDDIGRMIEAHIGNLKEGKKSAEALADKAFDRAFRAEAALARAEANAGEPAVGVSLSDLKEWRSEWIEANDPGDDTDCVTPFDKYLYTHPAPQPSGKVEVKPLADLIHDALAFAVWAAGEGLCPTDGPPAPEDFLYAYSTATGFEDWDAIPHHVATILSALTEEPTHCRDERER